MTEKKYYTTITGEYDPYTLYYGGRSYSHEKEFDSYEEAVKAAKKTAAKTKEDVLIYTVDSVVKFPEVDYEVEKVS